MTRILHILLLLAIFLSANAQSLDECRRLACDRYPEIKQYDLIALSEHYNLSNAARAWIPQITLSAQATYQSATPTYPEAFRSIMQANGIEMLGIRKDQHKVAIDISQNIWDGGQSEANKAIAKADAAEQRSRVEVSLYDVQVRVDNLYFGILLLDESIAQTEALIELLKSNLKRMQSYYNNGVAHQADVDAVEAELLTAQQTLGRMESSRASYRRMLEAYIGQRLSDERLERPAMPKITSRNSARPELKLFQTQENKLSARRKAINASLMPKLTAFAQGYYGYPGMDMFKSMISAKWTPNALVGIRMSWNIGAFYTRKNNLDKLDVAERQIAVQREVFLFNTELQTMNDEGEIARLHKAVENDARIVELRHRVRMAAESQFINGVIDVTDLLQKITDETSASLALSSHEIELLQASYRLKTTLNQ